MIKLDLRKSLKAYYAPTNKKVELVDVPCFNFVKIDGKIEPGLAPGTSSAFSEAMQALYGISYGLKFMSKQRKEDPVDYTVMPLEGLWWVEGGEFRFGVKDNWAYTVMIMQPDPITPAMYDEALRQLKKKKGDQPAFSQLRFEPFQEGRSIQIMHLGPYDAEPATIEKMDEYARQNSLQLHGKHHEIYLGNPMLAQPEKLKTILRHPVL